MAASGDSDPSHPSAPASHGDSYDSTSKFHIFHAMLPCIQCKNLIHFHAKKQQGIAMLQKKLPSSPRRV